ncbi:RagB/SusD family nutrient uptake outer membrane protein [Pedobacter nyackensis]|uniref:SusD family protein n=1 Tax=Pedobacter nyackensis TaxID=475255 RepID=A0A1W2AGZ1_9SPHI|nr:RagB/SusD family nutrient uptake outer membrane protein [Pedobacter nyackensis]SMC59957.1 SusD family protein [Pedobacter nyackensis]
MNRNNFKKIASLFLIYSLVLFSCQKVLDPEVVQLPTADNAIQTAADVDKAVAAAYSFLRSVLPDKVFLMGDVRANTFESYSQTSNTRPETLIATNTIGPLLNNGGGDWSGFYKVIAQCNLVLESIPTIQNYDQSAKRRSLGEASFLRGLTYFYLTRFWGDVPVNLKAVDVDNISRTPQAQVYDQIKKDLDVAIANLAPSYSAGDKAVRATKGAAWAIKAHVLAWLQDYAGSEKLCDSVINNGQYSLIADTTQLLRIFIGKSQEGIFELNFDAALKEVQKNKVYNRTLGRPWYTDGSDGGGGTEKFLLCPPPALITQMFPVKTVDGRKSTWLTNSSKNYDPTRPYLGKYRTLQVQGDTTSQNINESNIIVTRLADIMLLRAEALASTQVNRPAEAIIWLNKVRERAKAREYTSGGSLQDTILLERRKELLGEGQIFFDYVRTRKLAAYSKITQADWYTKGAWLLPISQTILSQSGFIITQNSFWQ